MIEKLPVETAGVDVRRIWKIKGVLTRIFPPTLFRHLERIIVSAQAHGYKIRFTISV